MADKFGPEYIVKVSNPQIGMEGFLVIDNTAFGLGKGGIRMTPNVSEEEIARLARTMTWKNALAGLPFGGAKAGIKWPGGPDSLKKEFIQSFARAINLFIPKKYVAGPDVNTGEREMQWFVETTKKWNSATGKPANLCMKVFGKQGEKCGIPHEFGSTGFGVAHTTKIAAEMSGLDIKNTTIAIHGFGNVGTFAYKYLMEMGAKIIMIADASGVILNENGFDKKEIEEVIKKKKGVVQYAGEAKKIKPEDFWSVPVDILIPASVTDVINDKNKNDIKAKIIIEAANIPMSEKIEDELFKKGILIVPDFVANAGGVISSYAEYRGYNPRRMLEMVENKIVKNAKAVLKKSLKQKRNPRQVALEIAKKRVEVKTRAPEHIKICSVLGRALA